MAVFITAIPGGGKDGGDVRDVGGARPGEQERPARVHRLRVPVGPGEFDKDGWFAPLEALPATAGHELVVHATYNPSPVVFSYTYKFKPDYGCITSAGRSRQPGAPGGPERTARQASPVTPAA